MYLLLFGVGHIPMSMEIYAIYKPQWAKFPFRLSVSSEFQFEFRLSASAFDFKLPGGASSLGLALLTLHYTCQYAALKKNPD